MGGARSARSTVSAASRDILESTGIVSCYEGVLAQMIREGWPKKKNIYDHVADLVLEWGQQAHEDRVLKNRHLRKAS